METNVFGARLKQLRELKGMSQEQAAAVFGVTRGTLGNYELGKRDPDTDFLRKVCRFYECSSDFLLGLSDSMITSMETVEFQKKLGLSDAAMKTLLDCRVMVSEHENGMRTDKYVHVVPEEVSYILENKMFFGLITTLRTLSNASKNEVKAQRNRQLVRYMGNLDFYNFILGKCLEIAGNIFRDIAPPPIETPRELTGEELDELYGITEDMKQRVWEVLDKGR